MLGGVQLNLPIPSLVGFLGLPALALGLVAGAAASYVYVPIVGRPLAFALALGAAATFSYDAGYNHRGDLDHSAALQAQIETLKNNAAILQQNADDAARIADDAAQKERAAEADARAIQEKVAEYEVELAKRPDAACALSDDDVRGLRNIGTKHSPRNPPKPPARPGDVR